MIASDTVIDALYVEVAPIRIDVGKSGSVRAAQHRVNYLPRPDEEYTGNTLAMTTAMSILFAEAADANKIQP